MFETSYYEWTPSLLVNESSADTEELDRLERARRDLVNRSALRREVIMTLEATGALLKRADAALLHRYREQERDVALELMSLERRIDEVRRHLRDESHDEGQPHRELESGRGEAGQRFQDMPGQLQRRAKGLRRLTG
jgi:hypothetical protein